MLQCHASFHGRSVGQTPSTGIDPSRKSSSHNARHHSGTRTFGNRCWAGARSVERKRFGRCSFIHCAVNRNRVFAAISPFDFQIVFNGNESQPFYTQVVAVDPSHFPRTVVMRDIRPLERLNGKRHLRFCNSFLPIAAVLTK